MVALMVASLGGVSMADDVIPGPEATAKKLFKLIKPINEEVKAARALHKDGKHQEALDAWRDWKVRQLRAVDLGKFGWHGSYLGQAASADSLVGRKPKGKVSWVDLYGLSGKPGTIGKINWIAPGRKGWEGDYSSYRAFIVLAARFYMTGDPIYVRKWFEITAQFCLYQKGQMAKVKDRRLKGVHSCAWSTGAQSVLSQASRVGTMIKTIGVFAKSLSAAGRKVPWNDVLTERPAKFTKKDVAVIPSVELAHVAISLVQDHPDALLRAYLKPGYLPNQRLHGLLSLLQIARFFPEFPRSGKIAEQADKGCADYVGGAYLIDGGILEQSFNYNDGDVYRVREVLELNGPGPRPSWLGSWVSKAANYRRMGASLLLPVGSRPQQGNGYMVYSPQIWKGGEIAVRWKKTCLDNMGKLPGSHTGKEDPLISQIVQSMFGDGKKPPAFTSVCFPYSGYTMMRDGWDTESLHLYCYQGRPALGHMMWAHGSVQVCAFGRMLLVMSGPPTYGFKLPPGVPRQVDKYLDEHSTYKGNTVIVDRKSQGWYRVPAGSARQLRTPAVSTWHTSPNFDVLGDKYDLWYDANKNKSVDHTRRIVFVKELKLWVVVDIMHSRDKKVHNYRQLWNFMPWAGKSRRPRLPGFREADVTFDAKAQMVATAEAGAPNVRIHNLGPAKLTYHKYHGGKEWRGGKYADMTPAERKDMPLLGWFSPHIGNPMPAVDIHAEWEGRGNQILLSVIEPMRRSTSSIKSIERTEGGFTLTTNDGAKLTCLAGVKPARMQAGALAATAQMLLVLQPPKGDPRGIVMDCTKMAVEGNAVDVDWRSFEFKMSGAKLKPVAPIGGPRGFRWIKTPEGVKPSYDGTTRTRPRSPGSRPTTSTSGVYAS